MTVTWDKFGVGQATIRGTGSRGHDRTWQTPGPVTGSLGVSHSRPNVANSGDTTVSHSMPNAAVALLDAINAAIAYKRNIDVTVE